MFTFPCLTYTMLITPDIFYCIFYILCVSICRMNLQAVYKYVWGVSSILLLVNSRDLRTSNATTTLHQLPEEEIYGSSREESPKYENNGVKEFLKEGAGCASGVLLLIVVCSAISHFQEREAIRSTWGSYSGTEVSTQSR